MTCGKCSAENAAGAKFCIECGESFTGRCPKCGSSNPANAKFCQECGTSFGSATEPIKSVSDNITAIRISAGQPGGEIPERERKTVTALFADIKGSTELMRDLDPEEASAIIDPALRIMIDAVKRYGGYVVQSTGDGIFALFGAPAAYEDHPRRGLFAALQIQRELREHGERRVAAGHARLEARIGVNTNEVVVRSVETGGRVEYTPIGHTANLASRLQTVAPAGSIAVSDRTRKLTKGYFEIRALGPMAVRGISEAIEVYEVTGLGTLRTHFELWTRRGLTKFVGRESELEQMRRALDLATGGHGQMVADVHQIAREITPALEAAEAAITIAEKEGVPLFESWARIARGWALAHLRQAEQGIAQILEGLAMASATGAEMWRTYNLAQLAEACGKAGRIDEGLEVSAEALEVGREKGERWWEAEILRLRGELLLKRNPAALAEAEASFERSIEIARKQDAKSLELRLTTSLARLLAEQGRHGEECAMLTAIYNWFTEGFDTADLKDAKALLDELGN
jgi:class 3 adenylate cyclase